MVAAKPLRELTAADLEQHAIWRYLNPADPAQLVAPYTRRGVAPLLSFVRCTFVAADGTGYTGFGLITKVALITPVILTPDGQVRLYHGDAAPASELLADSYRKLCSEPERLFPITFSVDVRVRTQPIWNTFDAFTYRRQDGSVGFVH